MNILEGDFLSIDLETNKGYFFIWHLLNNKLNRKIGKSCQSGKEHKQVIFIFCKISKNSLNHIWNIEIVSLCDRSLYRISRCQFLSNQLIFYNILWCHFPFFQGKLNSFVSSQSRVLLHYHFLHRLLQMLLHHNTAMLLNKSFLNSKSHVCHLKPVDYF